MLATTPVETGGAAGACLAKLNPQPSSPLQLEIFKNEKTEILQDFVETFS